MGRVQKYCVDDHTCPSLHLSPQLYPGLEPERPIRQRRLYMARLSGPYGVAGLASEVFIWCLQFWKKYGWSKFSTFQKN